MMINFNQQPLFLAPLAGLSDPPFRSLIKRHGCDVTISEMISANALIYENAKTLKMLEKSPLESPYIVQLEASDESVLARAVAVLNEINGISGIDLNCGCPVPKVIKQGAGSALLKEPKKLCKLIETIKKTSTKSYTSAKLRLGFDSVVLPSFVRDIQNAGADYICVHARTRSGGFSTPPLFEILGELKTLSNIPIIANGSIDEKNYKEILNISGANGVMIGRASIGSPWIFNILKGQNPPNAQQKKQIIKEHFELVCKHYGEFGASIFRKHLHEYSKNMRGASEFRTAVNSANNEQMKNLIQEFF